MTEPVAYLAKSRTTETVFVTTRKYPSEIFKITPLYTAEQLHPRVKMTQADFDELEISLINAQFDYSELKKTIEIVPDMKWFVRSKKSDINGYGWLSIIDKYPTPVYQYSHDKPLSMFVRFNTKKEAEKWTNPLTEAVQLAVEDE